MKNLTNQNLTGLHAGGWASAFCTGTAIGLAYLGANPIAAGVVASSGWGTLAVVGSAIYCAGYINGAW